MIPLIISTGMIDKQQVTKIYETVRKYHTKFCLLHCISSYPVPVQDCNLNVITDYKSSYPEITIGYSGHEAGITVTLGAVTLGAKVVFLSFVNNFNCMLNFHYQVVERHFTLDKSQKGSDHICSLTPGEMTSLINEINILTQAFGDPIKKIANSGNSNTISNIKYYSLNVFLF